MDTLPPWVLALIFVLFVALPIGIFVIGGRLILMTLRFKERAQPTSGTVVEVKETYNIGEDNVDRYTYQPAFEFASQDGRVLRGTSASSGSNMNYDIGSIHTILVDFENPSIVHTKGNHAMIVGVGCVVVGGTTAIVGIGALLGMI